MTRAVLFDVDGVLINGYHFRPELRVKWDEHLERDMGVNPDRFRAEFIYELFVKQVIVGRMSLLDGLDRVLPGLGYRGPSLAFARYWLEKDSNINQPLLDLVAKLKAVGTPLYIATNQEHLRAQWLWGNLGFRDYFEDIFYAARIGATKPHKPFFDWVSNRLGPQSEPPLFFDDTPEVVKAARAHGWEAVEFTGLADAAEHPWIKARIS
jgi:putative hydrolase of the HAD superfamily